MNEKQKIVNSWIIIGISILAHSIMETGEALFFKPLPVKPYESSMLLVSQIINLSALVVPIILGYLTMFFDKKGFKLFSIIYAVLLALLNLVHFVETVAESFENFTQIILLLFVAIVNITLIVLLNKWRKSVE